MSERAKRSTPPAAEEPVKDFFSTLRARPDFADWDEAAGRCVGARIFACALRDELAARARAGDHDALEILLKAFPGELPRHVLLQRRDDRIRDLARWLRSLQDVGDRPPLSNSAIAVILASVGRRIERGPSGTTEMTRLSVDQQAYLEAEVKSILTWAPVTQGGSRWLAERRIFDIAESCN